MFQKIILPVPCADGSPMRGISGFNVVNPATEEILAECPLSGAPEVETAVKAASAAFKSFSETSIQQRRKLLLDCSICVRKSSDEIAWLITCENGKPFSKAQWEVNFAAEWFEKIAAATIPFFQNGSEKECYVETRLEPAGVVAGIVPWNFPVKLAVWKIAAALLMGNTIVIKPSPYTPFSTLKLIEVLQNVMPPGIINSVAGASETGKLLCQHPLVRKISFTGSTAVGKHIGKKAMSNMKMITLELGGNDAAIILDDVNVKEVAPRIFWSAFSNLGQTCTSIKRLYVASSIFNQLTDELSLIASKVCLGDGFDPKSDLGPISNQPQLERIINLTNDALKRGGQILCGGSRLNQTGYFYPPTIVTGLPNDAPLIKEEQFGPVLPIISFSDIDEAIDLANDVDYALGGSVWSNDQSAVERVIKFLECGTCWVNWHGPVFSGYPFGGRKSSGFGYEHGLIGLLSFCSFKVINRYKNPSDN